MRSKVFVAFVVTPVALLAFPTNVQVSSAQINDAAIAFLNPSGYAPQEGVGIIVSDLPPSSPEQGDETYRLSAWISNPPPDPAVEFELLNNGVSLLTIDASKTVGADTFEADWDIPDTLPDGPYTMRATIASAGIGVDSVDQNIVIQRLADRAEITIPDNRGSGSDPVGQWGTYAPLAVQTDGSGGRREPIGNIDGLNTGQAPGAGASRVMAFYSIATPGSKPDWIKCGSQGAPGAAIITSAANDGVRCTLQSHNHQTSVSAVALAANNANGQDNPELNQAGDATRVTNAYAQVPTLLEIVEGKQGQVEESPGGGFECYSVVVSLADQEGREINGANLDVHALGPNDGLRFDTGVFQTYGGIVPDRREHSTERGYDCLSRNDEEVSDQAEHQVIAGPDIKHIESDAFGSEDDGTWGFDLFVPASGPSAERHTTFYSLWVDEQDDGTLVNDDLFASGELCTAGLVGWGATAQAYGGGPSGSLACEPPPPCPTPSPSTNAAAAGSQTGTCPGGEDPEPPPPSAAKSRLSIDAARTTVRRNARLRFSGRIRSDEEACLGGRRVALQSRRGDRRFKTRNLILTDEDGSWSMRRRITKTSDWRARVGKVPNTCTGARSKVVRVKVRRAGQT